MDFLALFDPESVTRWIEAGGYLALFGLLFACGLGLPLPEDIPLLIAGYFVAHGQMSLVVAGVVAWCGIIGGDCILYYLGHRFGLEITRVPFVGKHVTKERILKAETLFETWGVWVVAVCRLLAGIRGAMVVAAGAIRFSFVKFIIADGLAALVSGGIWIALGYWLGRKLGSVSAIKERIRGAEHWVFGSLFILVALTVLFIWWRRKRHKPKVADVVLEKVVVEAEKHPLHSKE